MNGPYNVVMIWTVAPGCKPVTVSVSVSLAPGVARCWEVSVVTIGVHFTKVVSEACPNCPGQAAFSGVASVVSNQT